VAAQKQLNNFVIKHKSTTLKINIPFAEGLKLNLSPTIKIYLLKLMLAQSTKKKRIIALKIVIIESNPKIVVLLIKNIV